MERGDFVIGLVVGAVVAAAIPAALLLASPTTGVPVSRALGRARDLLLDKLQETIAEFAEIGDDLLAELAERSPPTATGSSVSGPRAAAAASPVVAASSEPAARRASRPKRGGTRKSSKKASKPNGGDASVSRPAALAAAAEATR